MINGAGSAVLMLVFLIALVLISRLRSAISSEYRSELNLIAGGITVLSICELLVGLERSSSLASVPFLSDALFHQLTVWIGIITGSILTVSGMARWMPVIRKLKESKSHEESNSLLARLEQLSQIEHRPQHLFKHAFELICDRFQFEQGIGAAYSNADKAFYPLITLHGNPGEYLEKIESVAVEFTRSGKLKSHTVTSVSGTEQTVHTFAIQAAGKLVGIYLFWKEGEKPSHPAIKQIRTVCEIVGRVIDQKRLALTVNHTARSEALKQELIRVTNTADELTKYVGKLGAVLRNHFDCDYVSLSLHDHNGGLERVSVGGNGSLLKENGLDTERYTSESSALFRAHAALLIADSNGFNVKEYSRVLVNSGMRSIMAIKMEQAGRLLGVLLVASHEAMRYARLDLSLLSSLNEPVSARLVGELNSRTTEQKNQAQARISNFIARADAAGIEFDRYQEAANLLSDNLNIDLVRIALLDHSRTTLTTEAEVARRKISTASTTPAQFDLLELPLHAAVVGKGEMLVACDGSCGLSPTEESFLFSDVQEVVIAPIIANDNVVGTISIAHGRQLKALSDEGRQQASLVAAILGLMISSASTARSHREEISKAIVGRISKERREQVMRSSLSGILGSLEMIQGDHTLDQTKTKKFLEIIDRSARKLERSLELTN